MIYHTQINKREELIKSIKGKREQNINNYFLNWTFINYLIGWWEIVYHFTINYTKIKLKPQHNLKVFKIYLLSDTIHYIWFRSILKATLESWLSVTDHTHHESDCNIYMSKENWHSNEGDCCYSLQCPLNKLFLYNRYNKVKSSSEFNVFAHSWTGDLTSAFYKYTPMFKNRHTNFKKINYDLCLI